MTQSTGGVTYLLRVRRGLRRLRIAVHNDGRCVVTAPTRTSRWLIEQFISEHAAWIQEKVANIQQRPAFRSTEERRREFVAHKEAARKLAAERLAYFNAHYGFIFRRVAIRNQKTRWGSCSHQGNLNFSYKIALLPESLADYIVVHELCHLRELNHSPKFWQLVAQTIPDYLQRRRSLRKFSRANFNF